MKKWNKEGGTEGVEELLKPVADILRKGLKYKNGFKDMTFDYKGYRVFGDAVQPDERFSKEYLDINLEENGFDLIDNALVTAFQLGMEQQKRCLKDTVNGIFLINSLKDNEMIRGEKTRTQGINSLIMHLLPRESTLYERLKLKYGE